MNSLLKMATTAAIGISVMSGCSLSSLVDIDKPEIGSEIDRKYLDTRAGALGLLNSTLGSLQEGVSLTSLNVAILTDELAARPEQSSDFLYRSTHNIDTRVEPDNYETGRGIPFPAYGPLQAARVRANYARYFLRRQADSTLSYAISASFAYEGYAILLLAENLCSGVPLSKVEYGKEAVYGKALSTDSLLTIAIAKFDSSLSMQHDSLRFVTLAKIGKGRAFLALGKYREASETVADVGKEDVFTLSYTDAITPNQNTTQPKPLDAFWTSTQRVLVWNTYYLGHELVNNEGTNGLVWYTDLTNPDPRVPVELQSSNVVREVKFPTGTASLKLASWIDAKLIQAEYLLSTGSADWIRPINEARRTVGLADTIAPATKLQQIALLFRERAYWFYIHGTRLSDLRRLVRQYGRNVNTVFPIGTYSRSRTIFTFGDAVVFIPQIQEFTQNHAYTGCINRNP